MTRQPFTYSGQSAHDAFFHNDFGALLDIGDPALSWDRRSSFLLYQALEMKLAVWQYVTQFHKERISMMTDFDAHWVFDGERVRCYLADDTVISVQMAMTGEGYEVLRDTAVISPFTMSHKAGAMEWAFRYMIKNKLGTGMFLVDTLPPNARQVRIVEMGDGRIKYKIDHNEPVTDPPTVPETNGVKPATSAPKPVKPTFDPLAFAATLAPKPAEPAPTFDPLAFAAALGKGGAS